MKLLPNILFLMQIWTASSHDDNIGYLTKDKICSAVKMTTNYFCEYRKNALVIQGSGYLQIIKADNVLKITCFQNHNLNFENFPQLDMRDVEMLEIKGCSIKNKQTMLSEIKTHFNLVNVINLCLQTDLEKEKLISRKVFENFDKVEMLRFTTAKYDELSNQTFAALKNVKSLKMEMYDVSMLPSDIFATLERLKVLSIVNIAEGGSFNGKSLNLSLIGCYKLEKVSIQGIKRPVKIKIKLERLINHVEIKNNAEITELKLESFKYAGHIENLDLSNNSIKVFDPRIINQQNDLLMLNLQGNKIETVLATFFVHNNNLEEIDLSHNQIFFVERNSFMSQHFLKRLTLSNNKLCEINLGNFLGSSLPKLEYLSLNNNLISQINGEIPMQSNLKFINLNSNKMSRLFVMQFWPKSKKNLTISVANNQFDGIDFQEINLSNQSNFLTIELGRTPIICNCHTVGLFRFLARENNSANIENIYRKIHINPKNPHCKRTSKDVPKYVKLLGSKNTVCPLDTSPHFNSCPSNCNCMTQSIEDDTLIIECSNVTNVPPLPNYKLYKNGINYKIILLLSGNGIRELPTQVNIYYNDVTKIYASHNFIETLTESNLPKNLTYLDLKNNLISSISPKVLARFSALKQIYLSQNPWNCSLPSSRNLIEFVKANRKIVYDFQLIQCSSGKYFLEFEDDSSCNIHMIISILATLTIFLFILTITLYYKNRGRVSEWIFLNDKYHLIEKMFDFFKPIDACILCTNYDKIFGNYINTTMRKSFKCCLLIKNWDSNERIPQKFLKIFQKSRRIVIILSQYFDETEWSQWSYANIGARIIFITKGNIKTDDIKLSNKMAIRFNDPAFWEKFKNSINHREVMMIDKDVEEREMFNTI